MTSHGSTPARPGTITKREQQAIKSGDHTQSRNGFWLLQKRLESERFIWPRENQRVVELTVQQLHWLLEGIDLEAMRGHEILRYKRAA